MRTRTAFAFRGSFLIPFVVWAREKINTFTAVGLSFLSCTRPSSDFCLASPLIRMPPNGKPCSYLRARFIFRGAVRGSGQSYRVGWDKGDRTRPDPIRESLKTSEPDPIRPDP